MRFLGNIWSRRLKKIGACTWSCRRALSLVWVVLVSSAPRLTQELLAPHPRHLFLPQNEREGKKQNCKDPWIPYCKSVKGRRENFHKESRVSDNAPDSLLKYYSRVGDTTSVFDWYEANLCPKVSAITKVRVKFFRVACSTESDILVLVCDRIILDVLGKNPTTLQKNTEIKKEKQKTYFVFYIFAFLKTLSFRQLL